jgi:uncharacterized OB-fold protein
MSEWLDYTEDLTLKGQIAVPYSWWVGETGSRFLITLRDEKRITGNRCSRCGKVFVPPRKNCGTCFIPITDWVDISDEGTVESFTVVRFPFKIQPVEVPFAYVLVKLDGADVSLLHIVKEGVESLNKGTRVKARFKEDRRGHIFDIECFHIIG